MIRILGPAILSSVLAWSHPLVAQKKMVAVEQARGDDAHGLELTAIGGITVSRTGLVYVMQPLDANIRVLDAAARPLRTVGRKGEGPGEFSYPSRLGWLGDTLWVTDPQARRISLFSMDGSFYSSFSGVVDLEEFPIRPTIPAALLINGQSFVVPDFARGTPTKPYTIDKIPAVTASRSGKVRDTVAMLGVTHTDMRLVLKPGTTAALVGRQPFSDDPLWAVSPQGDIIVVVDRAVHAEGPHAVRIMRRSVRDSKTATQTVRYTPIPFTPSERRAFIDQEVAGLVEKGRGSFVLADLERAYEQVLYAPPFRVPVDDVMVDSDGRVWLDQGVATRDEPRRWLVLDTKGSPLWEVTLPADVRVRWAHGNDIWASARPNTDAAPYVVRYRIAAPSVP